MSDFAEVFDPVEINPTFKVDAVIFPSPSPTCVKRYEHPEDNL